METKVCTRCKEEKPMSDYYWYKKGQRPYPHCIPCNRIITKEKRAKYGYSNMSQRLTNKPNTWKDDDQKNDTHEFLTLIGWKFNKKDGIWYDNKIKDKDGKWLVKLTGKKRTEKQIAAAELRTEELRKRRYLPMDQVPVLNLRDKSIDELTQKKVMVAYYHFMYTKKQLMECFPEIPEKKLDYMITRSNILNQLNGTRTSRGDRDSN